MRFPNNLMKAFIILGIFMAVATIVGFAFTSNQAAQTQAIGDLAQQSHQEANVAAGNESKNQYTVNASDPDYIQYTGNRSLTFIDQEGTPHVYSIDSEPNYESTLNYPNSMINYYNEGSTLTPEQPSDDQVYLHRMEVIQ